MRKIFIAILFLPVLGLSQGKNVLTSNRVFCKTDKVAQFEAALASHAQKFHKGDWHWRVWSIQSGPDAGGYMISEGPSDWSTIDGRGDINPAHQDDWNKNVSPLTSERGSTSFSSFNTELSTVQLTDFTDKIMITHTMPKPGKINEATSLMNRLKKVWEAGKESVAVYNSVASGDPSFITVNRLKNGFKELATGYRKPIKERYEEVHGTGSWDTYLKDYADAIERRWSELLVYKSNLSSK